MSKQKDEGEPKPKKTFFQQLMEWVKAFVFALVVMVPLRSSIVDWFDVPSGSMEPTIVPGDRIFVNKLAYGLRVPLTDEPCRWITKWNSPARGEIVICYSPEDGTRLVKRIIGIAGDTIELRAGKLFINGTESEYGPLEDEIQRQIDGGRFGVMRFARESFEGASHPVVTTPNWPQARELERGGVFARPPWNQPSWTPSNFGPIEIPAGKVFVVGDSRDQSKDSRYFGYIDEGQVVGRSPAVVFSWQFSKGRGLKIKWDRFFRGFE
ncbi:MAG: signal peptidase I [Phycisphaeraceae bacterium]|nr:signal peptidase I [Phycisphaeraceae bacterium]